MRRWVASLPALALVKVVDGFNDLVGVTAADDGTGRIVVVVAGVRRRR